VWASKVVAAVTIAEGQGIVNDELETVSSWPTTERAEDGDNVRIIYLDNHASTPVDAKVTAEMTPYIAEDFANPHAADHAAGWRANEALETAAHDVASAIGADPDEIVFTSGATESNNLAILGLGRRAVASRRRILVSAIEHKCVLSAARALESSGFTIEMVPVDRHGLVDLEELRARLSDDVLLVSVMAVNNEIGTIQSISEISTLARNVGAYVHTDAAQGLASGRIDVAEWDIDTLSLSAHKIYGPKGIGALFIRRDVQKSVEPLIYGGGQQRGIRSGTLPVPLCVGLAAAVRIMSLEAERSERLKLSALRDRFVAALQHLHEGVRLNGPPGAQRHPGNASLRFPGVDGRDLIACIQPRVAASTGSACTSGTPEPSHVLRAIGLSGPEAESSVRFSLGRFTSDADIEEAVELIGAAFKSLHDRT
jgi:cysteine desulfurase